MNDFQNLVDSAKNVPDSESQLMACTDCGIILTNRQWNNRSKHSQSACPNNCENCETTPDFTGVMSIMVPRTSWVARYTRKTYLVPGIYAMNIDA